MPDVVITGASRGIGRALALALAARNRDRLVLSARDGDRLEALAGEIRARGGSAVAVRGDLASAADAAALGARIAALVGPGTTLVHNAGVWPSRRELTADGLERAFAVNHLGPFVLQRALLGTGRLSRILAVSAGLIGKGRFRADRTPEGRDFSWLRTYATTKLCFALAMQGVAAEHPGIDVAVLHPGVVRTGLGDRAGLMGRLLTWMKRRWEAPETCGDRLARVLARERWSTPGRAAWLFEEREQPWPAGTEDDAARSAVAEVTARLLA